MNHVKSMGDLAGKIVFLVIKAERLGNLRKSNVGLQTTANASRFSTNKKLLESPELKMIAKRDNEVKDSVKRFLLPYKVGVNILPIASKKTVEEILDAYMNDERPALVKALIAAYPDQVKASASQLKEQFNEQQYLPVENVEKEFSFDYYMWSLVVNDEVKDQAYKKIMDAADGIADALAVGAHTLVSKLADSLSTTSDGKQKKIYDSHFKKLQEFLAGFDIRNVTSNQELQSEMNTLKAIMNGLDVEKVRNNDGLREEIAKKMSDATEHLTTMVQHKGRKFRDAEPVV